MTAEMQNSWADVNDEVVNIRLLGGFLPFEYDGIRQKFNVKKLVREQLIAATSAKFSELRSTNVSTALFVKSAKNSVICYRCSQVGHVSKHCPRCKNKHGSEIDDAGSVCSDVSS